jgi:hypothetical protein
MNKSKLLFSVIFLCCAVGSLQAADSVFHKPLKKYYLSRHMIHVTKKGILVRTKTGFVKVHTLHSDKKGMFIYRTDLCKIALKGDLDGDYPCSGCDGNHTTSFARDACEARDAREACERESNW